MGDKALLFAARRARRVLQELVDIDIIDSQTAEDEGVYATIADLEEAIGPDK